MKNIFYLSFLGFFLFTSCSEDYSSQVEIRPIDNITVADKNGSVIEAYQYDVQNEQFINEVSRAKTGGGGHVSIKGDLVSKDPNDTGGHNYFCIVSSAICYSNE